VRRKALRTFTGFTTLFCILFLLVFPVKAGEMPSERNLQHIGNIIEMIGRKYNGDISEEQLLEGALKGMFGQMDPYTIYYTVEEASDFFGNIEGTYEGIGVSIEQAGEFIIVSKVFTLSPAEEAGIRARDVIVSVDGESVVGFSASQVSNLSKLPITCLLNISIKFSALTPQIISSSIFILTPLVHLPRQNAADKFTLSSREFFAMFSFIRLIILYDPFK
jgi:membrane-associated protease RseP (regulator of RpoE activity)